MLGVRLLVRYWSKKDSVMREPNAEPGGKALLDLRTGTFGTDMGNRYY